MSLSKIALELMGYGIRFLEMDSSRQVSAHLPEQLVEIVINYAIIPASVLRLFADRDFNIEGRLAIDDEEWEFEINHRLYIDNKYIKFRIELASLGVGAGDKFNPETLYDTLTKTSLSKIVMKMIECRYAENSDKEPLERTIHLLKVSGQLADVIWNAIFTAAAHPAEIEEVD